MAGRKMTAGRQVWERLGDTECTRLYLRLRSLLPARHGGETNETRSAIPSRTSSGKVRTSGLTLFIFFERDLGEPAWEFGGPWPGQRGVQGAVRGQLLETTGAGNPVPPCGRLSKTPAFTITVLLTDGLGLGRKPAIFPPL